MGFYGMQGPAAHAGLALAALLMSEACAPTVKSAAREASSAAVDQSVNQLTSEKNKAELAKTAQDPRVQEATTEMSEQITEGVLRSLQSEPMRAELARLTKLTADTAVRQAVMTLGSEDTRDQLSKVAATVTQSTLSQVSRELKTELGPAVQETLREDVAQGLAGALRGPALNGAIGSTAQTVAYNAVLGAQQGVDSAWLGEDGIASGLKSASRTGASLLWLIVAALTLLALALVCGAIMAIARVRRAHHEVTRLESATLLLATALREGREPGETSDIVAAVQDSLERSAREHEHRGLFAALRLRGH
jgi:hypothetical protein